MAVSTEDRAGTRPASGIPIDPVQLTRMRDSVPMSRAELAARTGEILFSRDWLAEILAGQADAAASPDGPRLARALWLALGCEPGDIVTGLPAGLTRAGTPLWLRENKGWGLDLDAVHRLRERRSVMDPGTGEIRTWTNADLATAVSRHWFSRDMVNKIENGGARGRRPSAGTLRAFCQVLGCTPVQLMPEGDPLPPGETENRRELLDFNVGMREFADANGISYRDAAGRIKYGEDLRKAYAEHLAGQDEAAP